MKRIEEQLLNGLETFTAFVRGRVGDPHLAADIVQESLLKAVRSAEQLREDESVTAWFYRILRRTIIDLHRRREARQRALERLESELAQPPDAEARRAICACVETLITTLKPEYAELIRRLDLDGDALEALARQLGATANNLRVRHYRARQQLRERLEETCRVCAKHGCLDCTCKEEERGTSSRNN
jgi:RNA polymerase sigma-70 factor (ECF subfamily)